MAANNALVLAGISGGGTGGTSLAYFAPTGTAAPTDGTTALISAWKDAGWCTESGLSVKSSENSKDVNAYGSSGPVRTIVTNSKTTFDVGFLESNPISIAVYNRLALTGITVSSAGAFDFTSGQHRTQQYSAVFEMVDGLNHIRAYCPSVEVTDRQDFNVQAGNEISYGVTLTAYPGADGTAVHWFYLLDALKTA